VIEELPTVCDLCVTPLGPEDRFCEGCGRPAPRHDRWESDLGRAAGVTDRGRVRARNEDAVRVATVGSASMAIVCDGVASSRHGGRAAEAAAGAAGREFVRTVDTNGRAPAGPRGSRLVHEALEAAQAAVLAIPQSDDPADEPPSTTIVVALWDGEVITIGSVGDSRAYWIGSDDVRLLTVDDAIASGHAITRWLGADAPDEPWPISIAVPRGRGRVVVCSDGLWNGVPVDTWIADTDRRGGVGSPLDLARRLCDLAVGAGGQDNVTVAVLDIDPIRANRTPPQEERA
jgi:serine/threonine protein phosphatase PrpC